MSESDDDKLVGFAHRRVRLGDVLETARLVADGELTPDEGREMIDELAKDARET